MPYTNLTLSRIPNPSTSPTAKGDPQIYLITLRKAPENRISTIFAQEIIRALRDVERMVEAAGKDEQGGGVGAAVIIRGEGDKFWSTLLHTLLDYPFPTIALLNGHTFGGACPLALAHDYRVMNSRRGFFSMPPVNIGVHFPGIGYLARLKLRPEIAREMLLEAHKWTGKGALEDGIVDQIAEPEDMLDAAIEIARKWAPKAKMGVYAVLRQELWGEAARIFQSISYVHHRRTVLPPKVKI
ncbi:enoyl-CoA hydratase/isomerase [Histoplasma capsulatum G186AR]|uniref:Enoyl-CoA hydratase/isomerase n=2 Tax=Ajellomyces capsulatus TaxID=5037 RepID=C0NS32_AJECG|nr:enoyl-CoA hydratase/isomerase [Histoplasma capsulatum G186AR]EEH05698.1 enoyl-CoA hydratase/isomerase [Histoplasma capsulatum G186AR]